MAYLALWWKVVGYSSLVTRTAMVGIAAFALLGLFRLACRVANAEVAAASVLLTALYPVFFVQSTLAQVDLAAAGFVFWGLLAYVEGRRTSIAVWFSLAVLAKETAVLAPLALFVWELGRCARPNWSVIRSGRLPVHGKIGALVMLVPVVPLAIWYTYHYLRTGFVFGNAEFVRYNVQATLHPLRIFLAFLMRTWQALGYLHLWVLTLAAAFAMWRPALPGPKNERPRIAWDVQLAFLSIVLAHLVVLSVIGGAVLARYMLTVVPLVVILCVSTLWRRVSLWRPVVVIVALMFVAALFVNPPYGFPFEDNLAYRDYIVLHQHAEAFLEQRYSTSPVLTAWPANDELTRPQLGYVTKPLRAVRIEDFSVDEVMSAAELRSDFDVALVFSTKYEPPLPLVRWKAWDDMKVRFFGYHHDLPPELAARVLGGKIVFDAKRNGQWAAVIEVEQVHVAMEHGRP